MRVITTFTGIPKRVFMPAFRRAGLLLAKLMYVHHKVDRHRSVLHVLLLSLLNKRCVT
jgi:hypothetical protein